MSSPTESPVVRVSLNERIGEMQARSTYRFDLTGVMDDSPVVITTPTAFVYDGPQGSAFVLPPGRFVSIGQFGGWIYDLTVVPQLRAATLKDALTAAQTVAAAIAAAPSWRRVGPGLPAFDAVRQEAAGPGWRGRTLGQWHLAEAELAVNVKVGDGASTYFAEVRIFDGTRRIAYAKRTYAIRRARQHGNVTDPLPLALDDPTPVPDSTTARPGSS